MAKASRLSRRERQIMDVIYRLGRATVQQVIDGMDDAPSNSAVRTLLRLLEDKGHVRHVSDGPRYVYLPAQRKETARKSALRHLMDTFFDNSIESTVATLLDVKSKDLTDEELQRLQKLIEEARREKR